MPYVTSAEKQVYEDMMEIARENLDPEWKHGQVVVLETWPGQYHYLMIPDFMDPAVREPLEDTLIDHLRELQATRVLRCLYTTDGRYPEIPSWHLQSRLIEMDPQNLHTELLLQSHEDSVRVRPFSDFLPPENKQF